MVGLSGEMRVLLDQLQSAIMEPSCGGGGRCLLHAGNRVDTQLKPFYIAHDHRVSSRHSAGCDRIPEFSVDKHFTPRSERSARDSSLANQTLHAGDNLISPRSEG
jgi:hypothetical protein